MVSAHEYSAVADATSGPPPYAGGDRAVGARISTGQPHDRIQVPGGNSDASTPAPSAAPPPAMITSPSLEADVTLTQRMLSAVAGSVFTSLLVTPLDVVRVRLQSQSSPPSFNEIRYNGSTPFPRSFTNLPPNLGVTACCREVFWVNNNAQYCVVGEGATISSINASVAASDAAAAECAIEETQRKTFTSTLDGLRKIARNEGLTTLWRGLSPTLVMAVPGNVIYFAGYDWLRSSAKSPLRGRVSDTYSPLVAGSTARVIAAFFVSPIELFRTRMQASQGGSAVSHFSETAKGVAEMVRTQGYHTLWRGLTLTLWRDVPFSALYWWGYEFTRNTITDVRESAAPTLLGRWADASPGSGSASVADTMSSRVSSRINQNHSSTLVDSFSAGAISGGVAAVITTPFDVGKTRQQVYRHAGDSQASVPESLKSMRLDEQSMPRFLWQIFKDEGMSGLFRGCAARVLKVAPACAIMISTYEMGKKMAQNMRDKEAERM